MTVWKIRQKQIRVSNFSLLLVFFKWHHGSEGVNGGGGGQVRSDGDLHPGWVQWQLSEEGHSSQQWSGGRRRISCYGSWRWDLESVAVLITGLSIWRFQTSVASERSSDRWICGISLSPTQQFPAWWRTRPSLCPTWMPCCDSHLSAFRSLPTPSSPPCLSCWVMAFPVKSLTLYSGSGSSVTRSPQGGTPSEFVVRPLNWQIFVISHQLFTFCSLCFFLLFVLGWSVEKKRKSW